MTRCLEQLNLNFIPEKQRQNYINQEIRPLLYWRHNILCENPHPNSMAGLVLLNKKYLNSKIFGSCRHSKYMRVKKRFLYDVLREKGKINCFNCNKEIFIDTLDNNLKATIDHIIPIHKNPDLKWTYDNFRPACNDCNSTRIY